MVVKISDVYGKKLWQTESLLDTGADTSIADERFLKSIGLKRKDLSKINERRIRGATQAYLNQIGTIMVQISYGSNSIEDKITIVDGNLAVPLLIRWIITMALQKDLTYPKTLNQIGMIRQSKKFSNYSVLGDKKMPSELGSPSFRAADENVGIF